MGYGRRNFIAYQRGSGTSGVGSMPVGGVGVGSGSRKSLTSYRNWILVIFTATILYTTFLYRSGGAISFLNSGLGIMDYTKRRLTIASWNIAAINNNPFEYWITYKENPDYEQLMIKVEEFIENPGALDVPVSQVFTETMFEKLDTKLTTVGWESVKTYWDNDFKNRKIVDEFLKDKTLGSKRLASMPDRVTNTINTEDKNVPTVFRPTVINMYSEDLSTLDIWYNNWEKFMFDTPLKIRNSEGDVNEQKVYELLLPISKSKYPDITEQEEKDSLPLQTMCGAIFDAILVHMMNTVSKPDIWQPLKRQIVDSLNKQKVPNTLKILETEYLDSDIITLQEVSSAFIDQARASSVLGTKFHIIAPKELDAVRDQNSVIFLCRKTFPSGSTGEITDEVFKAFPSGVDVPVSNGDILAITTKSSVHDNKPFVIASFHGDTNGLATIPVVDAIVKAMEKNKKLKNHHLIFGLDANTYETGIDGKKQDVMKFGTKYNELGLTSCWGDVPQPHNYTTYNARTYLQPQLNKACRKDEKRENGDVNPKDFILFPKSDYYVIKTWKDNTGKKEYIEDMAFPTIHFPSDHGILATTIEPIQPDTETEKK